MEFGTLGSLEEFEKKVKNNNQLLLPYRQTWHWSQQVTLALHYINHCFVRHRDLNIGNTFLYESDDQFGVKLKLGDFGGARVMEWTDPDVQGTRANFLKLNMEAILNCTEFGTDMQGVNGLNRFNRLMAMLLPEVTIAAVLRDAFGIPNQMIFWNRTGELEFVEVMQDFWAWQYVPKPGNPL